jgi:hypothetical protein
MFHILTTVSYPAVKMIFADARRQTDRMGSVCPWKTSILNWPRKNLATSFSLNVELSLHDFSGGKENVSEVF